MNSEKYIGLDVNQATICVAVMDAKGKVVMESILETKATTILEFLAGLRGTLSVTFEEGTWAAQAGPPPSGQPALGPISSVPQRESSWTRLTESTLAIRRITGSCESTT